MMKKRIDVSKAPAVSAGGGKSSDKPIVSPAGELNTLAGKYETAVAEESAATPPVSPSFSTDGGPKATDDVPKKRGRPRGSRTAVLPQDQMFIMRPMMKGMIQFPYSLAANRLGPHWSLSDEEAERMIDAHLALINRYLPDYIKEHTELYAVLLLHAFAITVRLSLQAEINAAKAPKREERPIHMETPGVTGPDRPGQARFGQVRPAPSAPAN